MLVCTMCVPFALAAGSALLPQLPSGIVDVAASLLGVLFPEQPGEAQMESPDGVGVGLCVFALGESLAPDLVPPGLSAALPSPSIRMHASLFVREIFRPPIA